MIAVIADDFTGAAEIGGVGLRHGLRVVIETNVEKADEADLLIIAADTRSLSSDIASVEIEKITRQLLTLHPEYIFKKLDSVLRGNIADELTAQMKVTGKRKAVIVAGNPHFKRLIKNGTYYVDNIPLAETFFAKDPHNSIKSSLVVDIVGKDRKDVMSQNADQKLPDTGLIVGDISDRSDMIKWREHINGDSLPAGGAGFFEILLERDFPDSVTFNDHECTLNKHSLLVFGSAFPKNPELKSRMRQADFFISNMPEEIYRNKNFHSSLLQHWADEVVDKIKNNQKVIISIDHSNSDEKNISTRIRENVGQLVRMVVDQIELDDLLIEGGATASVIFKCLKINRLYPFSELDAGVIQMKVEGYPKLCITTKPGSYNWPEELIFGN